MYCFCTSPCLVLTDEATGRVYARLPMDEGDRFSVEFIHSVNKSPVRDIYEIRDGRIFVVMTKYYAFGAGVQTFIEEGQTLTYGEDGSMLVSGFDKELPELLYYVGTVSDHVLYLFDTDGSKEDGISLRDLCGRSSSVRFSCRRAFTARKKQSQ